MGGIEAFLILAVAAFHVNTGKVDFSISPGVIVTPLAYDEFAAAGNNYQQVYVSLILHPRRTKLQRHVLQRSQIQSLWKNTFLM